MVNSASDVSARPARYYQQNRPDMLEYIPENVKRTLDLGCAEGNFSELIKSKFDTECWGVEINPAAAQIAETKLDKVITGDVTRCVVEVPDDYFDCIICNDILEHLADPYSLLLDIKRKLSANGVLVASFPNVRYCRNLFELVVRGNWDYKEHGILDKTHLRFFTYKSLVKLFPQLGYQLLTIRGIEPEPTTPARIVKVLNLFFFNVFVDTRFHHFACVAKPVRQGK